MNRLWFLIPALVNGVITVGVALAARRSLATGGFAIAVVVVIYLSVLFFWPGEASQHTGAELFWLYAAIVAVTWLPGALLALVAGRKWPRQLWLWAGAFTVGVVTSGTFVLALFFACSMLSDCL